MKKTVILLAAAAAMIFGGSKAQAQIEVPQVPAELQELVDGYVQTLM